MEFHYSIELLTDNDSFYPIVFFVVPGIPNLVLEAYFCIFHRPTLIPSIAYN